MPAWAEKGAENKLGVIDWSDKQYITEVQICNAVTHAMLDTGGHGSMIDRVSAEELGLDITRSHNGNYGHYFSPGYRPRPYYGIVSGPVPLRFSEEVVL